MFSNQLVMGDFNITDHLRLIDPQVYIPKAKPVYLLFMTNKRNDYKL